MKTSARLRIATRGSALALRQTESVIAGLQALYPHVEIELVVVRTAGDQNQRAPVSQLGDGAFVRGVEAALLDGHADAAVHSAKDIPSADIPGLTLAAFPQRGDARDVIVSREGRGFDDLLAGARVGTGSPRRAAIARAQRPDLDVVGIRGNVDTRLRKLAEGEYDAIVLAAAGLARMSWQDRVTEYLDPAVWVPASGQGALAVQCRAGDPVEPLLASLDDPATRAAVTAERAVLRRLGAGCRVPVGAFGQVTDDVLVLRGVLLAPDGSERYIAEMQGGTEDAEALGTALADELARQGKHLMG
jgi:hydroxymethylbilane synthase